MITQQQILEKLSKIIDPDFNKDIVTLGFIQNLKINQGDVSFEIALTTPACPVKDEFKEKATSLVQSIAGVTSVNVSMGVLKKSIAQPKSEFSANLDNIRSIIAVSSCKGGVGKSTVAAYLALELAHRGYKVGLVDCDIHGPSVPTLFNLHNQKIYTNAKNQLIPIEKNKLKIMSFGFLLGDAPAVLRGPIVTRYVQQLLLNTDWGELDYLFIDMPPGTGDVQLTITQTIRLSGAVIITTPQSLSLVDVARGIIMFEKVQVPILGVIENMAYFICDNCDKKHFIFGNHGAVSLKKRFGVDILAELPIMPQMILPIDSYVQNNHMMEATDKVVMALGKNNILQKQIPQIKIEDKELILRFLDGEILSLSHRDLRLSCECALCINEMTGKKTLKDSDVKDDIAPKEVFPLGNYALAIHWNDGHTSGIYPYDHIRKIAKIIA